MKYNRIQLLIAGIIGFTGVALGAFGAHGLKSIVSATQLATYKTGIFYHLIHSVILFIMSVTPINFTKSFNLVLAGTLLFSFSLYIMVLTGFTYLGIITPIGGILLLAGWIMIIVEGLKEMK